MPKHLLDETAQFKMPRIPRHAAADEAELDPPQLAETQRFDPGFGRPRPGTPAVPQRPDAR